MRAVVQRVKKASVIVKGTVVGEVGKGILVFLGISENDTRVDITYLVTKIIHLRIFPDAEGKMNLSLKDIKGAILVVSQFTLFGDCRKGRRPSFTQAASPEKARILYHAFIEEVQKKGVRIASGLFQEIMEVSLINDGPVTLLLDSKKLF